MKNVKKTISVILCLVMVLSLAVPMASAQGECNCGHTPMIYVFGRSTIFDDPTSPDRRDLLDIGGDALTGMVKSGAPILAKAVLTNNYDAYCDFLYEQTAPLFADFTPNKDGTVTNGSGIEWSWSPETLYDSHKDDNVYSFVYHYDSRLDPCDIADDLNRYVQAVKELTGHNKVSILSRCMGCDMAFAYLAEYGWDDVETFVQYASAVQGTTILSDIFAGKIELNSDAIDRYFNENWIADDWQVNEILKATISVLNENYTLGLTASAVNRIYAKIYANVLPRIMRASYGTSPGYWSMVAAEDYEQAKKLVFGDNTEEYAELIAKLDHYDVTVRQQLKNILVSMHDDGVRLMNITKYGFQMIPITTSYNTVNDNKISVYHQSFGATTSPLDSCFDKKYMENAVANGTDKYISPDKQIDASTCLFPDTTWFIKDLDHNNFPGCVNDLMIAACRSEKELTIDDDVRFPQYMRFYYWEDAIKPLTEENEETRDYTTNIFQAIYRFFKAVIDYLKTLFKNK